MAPMRGGARHALCANDFARWSGRGRGQVVFRTPLKIGCPFLRSRIVQSALDLFCRVWWRVPTVAVT
jgi:hypothetical protein